MIRAASAFVAGAIVLQAANASAADPSFMRVAVVPSGGQMSLVIEMSDEARRVATQQVTPTLLLIEAGPIALPLKRQILNAPSGLALVQRVSVDEGTTTGKEHVLRLGVTMKRPAPSTVRVVGRRVYVDFAVHDEPAPPLALPRAAPIALRSEQLGSSTGTYRQVFKGATSRLEEIQPFLLSAASSPAPNPAVLTAIEDAITSVQQSLRGVKAPGRDGASLQLLVSAVSLAAESVNADFRGDRASKAKQSIAALAAAKAQLQ